MGKETGFALQLATLSKFNSNVETDFNAQLAAVVADCKKRPACAKVRVLTLKVECSPNEADQDNVDTTIVVSSKIPAANHTVRVARTTRLNQLLLEFEEAADDGLATLAAYGRTAGVRTVLASPDKDLRQCLCPQVLLLRQFSVEHGRPNRADWYTSFRLFDEYGLEAGQWVDYQTLVGDHGDGVVGCPGWGEKTAATALAKCKTLEACFGNPWAVPCTDRQRGQLIKFREQAAAVRQLVTLRTDVSVVWDAMR